jgi:hypothetical protein
MKTLSVIFLTLLVLTLAPTASAESGKFGLGLGAHDGDFGVHLRKNFWLGGDISAITGQAGVFFHGKTTFKVDADYHFILNPQSPSRFYPLAGLQFGFNSNNSEFGLNLGGGATFMLTETMPAFGEAKFVFGDWDGFAFSLGFFF